MIRYPDIADAIQVRHLQVELEQALKFAPDAQADAVRTQLKERAFDRAPVVEGGQLLGLVDLTSLDGLDGMIAPRVQPVRPEQMVSADAPVSNALEWLLDAPFLFVLAGRRVTGFFVQGDLNKQPARLYFYLLVAALEMGLAAELRRWRRADDDALLAAMALTLRERVLAERAEGLATDTEVDLVDHLTFSEILRVIGGIDDLRLRLGSPTRRHWKSATGPMVDLRNAVMHPTRDLLDAEHPLQYLVRMERSLRAILERLADLATP